MRSGRKLQRERSGYGSFLFYSVLAILGLLATWSAAVTFVDGRVPTRSPVLAIGSDVRALAALRAGTAARDTTEAQAALSQSRQALRDSPLASDAYVGAAFALQRLGEPRRALDAMTFALTLNPRNMMARAWTVENALTTGHYGLALEQLDAIMRQKPATSGEITRRMPLLLLLPGTTDELARRLAARPTWGDAFVNTACRMPKVVAPLTAAVVRAGELSQQSVNAANINCVIVAALDRGDTDSARHVYRAFYPAIIRPGRQLADGGFDGPARPLPFGWSFRDDPNVKAERVGGKYGILQVHAGNGNSIDVANQRLLLAPGRYRLSSTVLSTRSSSASSASWQVRCGGDLGVIGSIDLPGGDSAVPVQVAVMITIPTKCTTQMLALRLAQRSAAEMALAISDIRLTPLAGGGGHE